LKTGSLVIAMRVLISPAEWSNGSDPGFFATNLTLGQQDTLAQQDWLAVVGENAPLWLDWSFEIGIGLTPHSRLLIQSRGAHPSAILLEKNGREPRGSG
jgi:hypothetical protein